MGDTRNYAALDWVIGEIGDTLKEARQALEAYVEDPKDSTRIRFCLTHIHQVHGTLQMVEFHGASLLAEEMEQLAQALLSDAVSSTAEAHEVLMRSLLQLPIYLDHVKTQRDDHPGVILPLLNDLRAVRKQSYLSESNLFAPDLTPAHQVAGKPHPATADTQKLKQVLEKLREMYQFAAAAVLRGVKVEENLGYLNKVCSRLESLTTGTPSFATWHLAAALAEGLERDDIELSVAVRGLLRHLARELRVLVEKCPQSLKAAPRENLLKNLLYYIARAEDGSERIARVKQAYQLDNALLYGSQSARTSDKDFISAPDPEAIRSVVVALQEEINSIKHILDISLTGQGGLEELEGVLPIVKRVADTLAVLGIGDLRKQIVEQYDVLRDICEVGELDEDRLMQVAGRIIEIEHRLQAVAKGAGKTRDLASVDERGLEIDQAKAAVLAECQRGLEQAKDAIVEYIASKWDASHLANVSSLMSDIRGGLEIIPLLRPAAIMDSCGKYVQEQLLDAQITPDWQTLDKLADTIASVDYYLERLREDREEDLDAFLDIAERSIQSLGYSVTARSSAGAESAERNEVDAQHGAEPASEAPATSEIPAADASEAHEAEEPNYSESEPAASEPEEGGLATADGTGAENSAADVALDESGDTDAVESERTAVESSSTSDVVNAEVASLEGGSMEQPVETVDYDLGAALQEDSHAEGAVAGSEAFEDSATDESVASDELQGTDEVAVALEQNEAVDVSAGEAEPEPEPESDIDDEIIEIFIEEAGEVQETLAEFFPQWRQNPNDQDSLTIVRRAFHTLKGSGRMVEALAVGELAWSIENMLNRVIDNTIEPQDEHFTLIEMVLAVLPSMVKAFEERRPNPCKALTEQYMAWAFAAADGKMPADLQRAVSRWQAGERPSVTGTSDDQAAEHDAHQANEDVAANEQTVAEAADEIDEGDDDVVLWEIFASEAESHLATLDDFIQQMEDAAPLYTPPSDNMQRALHTLKGSAHMAHVTPIAELATPLESFVKELRSYQVSITDDILQLIKDAVSYTRMGLEDIEHGRPVELPKLPQFLARTAELRELAVGHLARQREVERDGHKQVDPRLLSIFMAEEMKLLLDADQILDRWQQNTESREEIDPLVTELTTLQAGATQANLPEMAGLSELLHKVYLTCLAGQLAPNDDVLAQLNQGHDLLLDMVDAVAAGQNLQPPSADLLDNLKALLPQEASEHEALADEGSAHTDSQDVPVESYDEEEISYDIAPPSAPDTFAPPSSNGADENDTYAYEGAASSWLSTGDDHEMQQPEAEWQDEALPQLEVDDEGELDLAPADNAVPQSEDIPADSQSAYGEVFVPETAGVHQPIGGEEVSVVDSDSPAVDDETHSSTTAPGAGEVQEPSAQEIEPSAQEEEPSAVDQEPSAEKIEPSAEDQEPSADGYEPSADGDEPSADGDEPSADDHQPLLGDQAPSMALQESAAESEASAGEFDELPADVEQQASDSPDEASATADSDWLENDVLASDTDQPADHESDIDLEPFELSDSLGDADPSAEPAPPVSDGDDVVREASEGTDAMPSEDSATASAAPSVIDLNDEDFDLEIIEIFLEEADELVDELDEAIHTWESNWDDTESPDTMARALHTLKGGARLANLMDIGELTHEYETFMLGRKRSDVDQPFFDTIHAFQDKLLRNIKNVRAVLAGDTPAPEPVVPELPADDGSPSESVEASEHVVDEVAKEQPAEPSDPAPATRGKVVPFAPKPKEILARSDNNSGFSTDFTMPPSSSGGPQPAAQPAPRRAGPQEVIKISAELLEELVNLAGETSISRGRLETQINDLAGAIDEIDGTLSRLQEQLRRLDIETEAQIIFRQEQLADHEDFDPLEMDRYSALQQLSRSLIESASDLVDLKATLSDKVKDTETLLLQQSRVNTNLQEGLMRSRMVPFSRLVPRLRRIVRQVATELNKEVDFELDNIEGEMDRSVLERMVAPLEHMLRNAVDHGIEKPADRALAGKPEAGRIRLSLAREGGDVLIRLADDGRGIDLKRVREKAIERGLMSEDAELTDHDIMQFILHAGFSTAENVTQISGRGVGMDVVHAEIKQLGGAMSIASRTGEGTEFSVRLPFTVSVNRALMVNLGPDQYAIPLNAIEGIVRVSPFELEHYYSNPEARFEYAGENFRVRYLGSMLSDDVLPRLEAQSLPLPVILVRSELHTMALQVDSLMGSREIVVKSLGPQFSTVQGLSGATVMGDGSVVVILDVHALVRKEMAQASPTPIYAMEETARIAAQEAEVLKTVMVVDDSVTVRKVTTRFLEREGYNVITAKDGVDALRILQDEIPDIMLLDIEMPRMDGFEVAKNVRTTSRWQDIPIIMITSRTGEKHREHALSLGVNRYMGKPYQEEALLESIVELLAQDGR